MCVTIISIGGFVTGPGTTINKINTFWKSSLNFFFLIYIIINVYTTINMLSILSFGLEIATTMNK